MYYNKSELFYLSAIKLYMKCSQVWLLSSTPCDIEELIGCTNEEAVTRMCVHASYAVQHGLKKFY